VSRSILADPPSPPVPPAGDGPRRRREEPPSGGAPRGWRRFLPYIIGLVLIIVGVFFGVVGYKMSKGDNFWHSVSTTLPMPVPPPEAVFAKQRIYVMLLGIDFNYDGKDMPYSKGARSDTIMVAGIDFATKAIHLVSVLRDSDAIVNGREVKINEAYAQGGPKLADRIIGEKLGLPLNERGTHFDRFVIVNSFGVKDFVDAIGGIDVPVTERMDYDDSWGHLHIHFKPGLVHMNGYQAMGYSRFRHDACSDPCRTKRQQQIIHITMQKLKGDKFNDLLHIVPLINALNKNIYTNLTFDEEKSLAWAFKDANIADLSHADTIPYVDTRQTADGETLVLDENAKTRLVAQLLGPYGNVTPPPASAIAAVKPSTVHVVVENGSGIAGLAGRAAQQLAKAGYIVDSIANADAFSYDTTEIRPASHVLLVGERVRADLGVLGATVSPATDSTPGPRSLVTVILGKDYALAQAAGTATSSTAPKPH
jgi:LCP family protein required for cell wall assembly